MRDCRQDAAEGLVRGKQFHLLAEMLGDDLQPFFFVLIRTPQKLRFAFRAGGDQFGFQFEDGMRHEQGLEAIDQGSNDGKHRETPFVPGK
jgi:hypothetical protein